MRTLLSPEQLKTVAKFEKAIKPVKPTSAKSITQVSVVFLAGTCMVSKVRTERLIKIPVNMSVPALLTTWILFLCAVEVLKWLLGPLLTFCEWWGGGTLSCSEKVRLIMMCTLSERVKLMPQSIMTLGIS